MNVLMPAEGRGVASQAPRPLPVQAGNAMSVQSQQELQDKVTVSGPERVEGQVPG